MPDVFISYNRQDKPFAQRVASALKDEGFDVWWDAALRAGESYDEVTERNLREAGAVVVLWSPRSANSKWVRAEATVGERSSTLVPVLIEDCDRPVRFELVQTADLRHWSGDRNDPAWRLFVLDVREAIANRKSAPVAAAKVADAAPDSSIETAFWTSIKDSREASEFEAYLDRFPQGHFADLARSRLANLMKSEPMRRSPPERAQAAVAEPANARPKEAPTQRAAPPANARESSNGLNPIAVVGGLVGLAALGLGLFVFMTRRPAETVADTPRAEAAAVPISAAASPPAETPPPPPLPAKAESTAAPAASAPAESQPAQTEKTYTDCDACPTMMRLAGGAFMMGSPENERGRNPWEGPQHEVTIAPFAIAVSETTEAQWAACVADGACKDMRSRGDPRMPVLGVSWREAKAYSEWLSKKSGKAYRLPSEAEWEYAARGGTQSAYVYGDAFLASKAARNGPQPSGSFDPNGFGLVDMHGNAREWVEDCYVNNFTATPDDGSAHLGGDCSFRTIRDGSWSSQASDMRVANRSRLPQNASASYLGFRVAGPLK